MSRTSEAVKRWRERTKLKIIESMGGQCGLCGYKKCLAALELHHIDPSKKEIAFGQVTANPKSWDKIVIELRKCILLCSNCHREFHHGFVDLPTLPVKFDENYINAPNDIYSYVATDSMDSCPVCGNKKPVVYKTCSKKCAASYSRQTDWSKIDVLELKKQGLSNTVIGEMIGVSNAAVWKRINKLSMLSASGLKTTQ